MYTDNNILGQCERRKKEDGRRRRREKEKPSSKKRTEKEEKGKKEKIREKVADSIGGNEFKMAARGSVPN